MVGHQTIAEDARREATPRFGDRLHNGVMGRRLVERVRPAVAPIQGMVDHPRQLRLERFEP